MLLDVFILHLRAHWRSLSSLLISHLLAVIFCCSDSSDENEVGSVSHRLNDSQSLPLGARCFCTLIVPFVASHLPVFALFLIFFPLPFLLLRSLCTDAPRGFRGGAVSYPGSEQSPKETHRWDSKWDDEGPEWVQHHCWKQRHQAGEWERSDTHLNPCVIKSDKPLNRMTADNYAKGHIWIFSTAEA